MPDAPELLPSLKFIDEIYSDSGLRAHLPVPDLNSEEELQRGREVAAAHRTQWVDALIRDLPRAEEDRPRTQRQTLPPATADIEVRHILVDALLRLLMGTKVPDPVRALPVRLVGESLVPLMDHFGYLVVMDGDTDTDGNWLLVDQTLLGDGPPYGYTVNTVGDLLDWADDHL